MTATADDTGKELDRQGHAVEPGADLGHGRRVRCDLGAGDRSPVGEQDLGV